MLEKMADFFENRLDGYDKHMLTNIESADEFYPYTAKQLPTTENCHILDLGCGTGLELEEYFLLNPSARITGIDLSQGMLSALKKKFADKDITLICSSYFDVPFGVFSFDSAVVEQFSKCLFHQICFFGSSLSESTDAHLLSSPFHHGTD